MASRKIYSEFTPIAARDRWSENQWVKVVWVPFPDAAVSPQEAMMLASLGRLLVTHRHTPEHVVMCVKTPAAVRRR
jgi:hypothetical protein